MIKIVTRAASLAALVLAACASHAQGLLTVPKFALMIDHSVRAELKMTPAQNQKVDAVLKEVMGEGGGRITIKAGQNLSSLDKGVERALTAPQRKRFYEIWLQRSLGLDRRGCREGGRDHA
jgi:outer membrane lipopolysaccharide assembly protein LptE/RlpB